MAYTLAGPMNPTVATDGGSSWSNKNNIFAEDGSCATAVMSGGGFTSALNAKGFGFDIPSFATITGVLVEIDRFGASTEDSGVFLLKAGTAVGTDKSSLTVYSSTSPGYTSYGGPTDLWGATWTPSDINNANFGATIGCHNTSGGSTANVDNIRITVYWTVGALAANLHKPKGYAYKVYNNGQYLGNLPNVTSVPTISQDMNTVGSQITVSCGVSADTSAMQQADPILDETGANITDEDSNDILASGEDGSMIGIGTDATAIIRNGNTVVVFEYSYYHPNGVPIFNGVIRRWGSNFGGQQGTDSIDVLLYSDGLDMDNHLVHGNPYTYTQDVSQTSQNSSATIIHYTADRGGGWNYYGQSFTTGGSVTNIGAILVRLKGVATVTVTLYASSAATTPLAVSTRGISVTTPTDVQFNFTATVAVSSSTSYFYSVTVQAGQSILIYYSNANPYASGTQYVNTFAGGSGGGSWSAQSANDLYFKTYSGNGATIATYTSQDPTTGMLAPIMNNYVAEGGKIYYDLTTIDATGLSLTYKFNTNTISEALQSILSIAPAGFYYYIDLGTDILYFKQASADPDVVFTKGRHLDSIQIIASIEYTVNSVYFSGNDVAGSNIYTVDQNSDSINRYGLALQRKSDVHINDTTAAHAVGSATVNELKDEQYLSVVTVTDKTMDTSLIHVGMIAGFNGFGTFVDGIVSQIVRIDRSPEETVITMGVLPRRATTTLEQLRRGLIAITTVDNPTSPS